MIDIELLLGEEAVDPHKENSDRKNQENATAGEPLLPRENEDSLPNPVRSPERRAEAFLTEWLRRLTRP